MRIIDPLPQRYLTTTEGVGGRIKVRAEDFLVDELPLYHPCAEGEHLYLGIQKANVSHAELMSCIRRHFGVRDDQIGFAGMKDKVGITRQTISVHLLKDPPNLELSHSRINVLWSTRHRNKLRLGHLAGNRFSVRIRDVDPLQAPLALRTLRELEAKGVPNYFGAQRFGYRRNNHVIGVAILREDWNAAASHLLGSDGAMFPPYQRERRQLFDSGRVAEAAALWTAADRSELIACSKLAQGKSAAQAIRAVGDTALSFWISALQSAIFNRVLDRRLEAGLFDTLVEGEIAFKHASRGMFQVTCDEIASGELPPRLASMEISPSGPLWGRGMMQAAGRVAQIEDEALEAAGLSKDDLLSAPNAPEGGRRALRCQLKNPTLESGVDEYGPYLRVAFDLPRGAYATIVLRELMKSDDPAIDDSPLAT
jgi:tRNA pseudouridine13 synthase